MRGKVAKLIRRTVYGDVVDKREYMVLESGQVVTKGLRSYYKRMKKQYKESR